MTGILSVPSDTSRRWRMVGLPTLRDPRLPFAGLLVTYVVLGITVLGFNRSPFQVGLIVLSTCLLDMLLHLVVKQDRTILFPLSSFISSLSLSILLNYSHTPYLLFLPVFLTVASKYIFTLRGRHIFNPSMFGVVVTLFFSQGLITTSPAYQWGGTWSVSAFLVTAALVLFVFKVDRIYLVVSFLLFYALQTAFRSWVLSSHLPAEVLFLGTLSAPAFYLFVFFMLTDPRTSPPSRTAQVWTALAIVLVDLVLHLAENLYTFLYAAFIVAAAKGVWGHWRAARDDGRLERLSHLLSLRYRRAVVACATVAALGAGTYLGVVAPVSAAEPGFRLDTVPAAVSGLELVTDGSLLDEVDPRLAHVAKWILSVGSSTAVADVDGDGREDVFMTHPMGAEGDRVALFRNRGGMRFERDRDALSMLDGLNSDPKSHGVASGGIFLDYDNDGDRDLLVLASFGESRLLENQLVETGRFSFAAVSTSEFSPYTTALTAAPLDYDGDGDLDLVLKNIMPTAHPGYGDGRLLDVFDLPEPEYEGDRRMFHFMHESWYKAYNGGEYQVFENEAGRFSRVDAAALGLVGTGWTQVLGSADLTGDGRSDLYVANDFGPDEVLVSQEDGRFEHVPTGLWGTFGRDTYKGMNASMEDVDSDGDLDVYVSNVHHSLQAEGSLLWVNEGTEGGMPIMSDEAVRRGVVNENRFAWGAGFGDLDLDGDLDLVQANGMVGDHLDATTGDCPSYWYVNARLMQSGPEIHTYADNWGDIRGRCIFSDEKRRVYLNLGEEGDDRFLDVAEEVGLVEGANSRGVALADFDGNGRLDVLVTNQHEGPTLLRNEPISASSSFLDVELVGNGTSCSRDAYGTRVQPLVPGRPSPVEEVQAQSGFSAQSSSRAHFGLGDAGLDTVTLSLRWCDGTEEVVEVPTSTPVRLVQDVGITERPSR